MARFFEKLQADGRKENKLAQFFSSHPSPGNRVKSVTSLVQQLPKQQYTSGDAAALGRMQAIIHRLPPPKPRKPAQPAPQPTK
jgi:predicted Zn-dependent protease